MADPNCSDPGSFGDVQPWRRDRGTADYPLPLPCVEYRGAAHFYGTLSPGGYGFPWNSCLICGHLPAEHESSNLGPES